MVCRTFSMCADALCGDRPGRPSPGGLQTEAGVDAPMHCAAGGYALVATMWAVIALTQKPPGLPSAHYRQMKAWAATYDAQRSTILAFDIGAIGYYSNAYIFDAIRLVWKDRNTYRDERAMVLKNEPDYVMVSVTVFE